MGVEKIASSIGQKASSALNTIANKAGSAISEGFNKTNAKGGDSFVRKFINSIEPNGSNNEFIPMFGLMMAAVVAPRVRTALKRNPDNKEATKDEIKEILFRDLQTVAILLFALKSFNTLISAAATKMTGLPMNNKAYQKLFNSTKTGIEGAKEKFIEFMAHPVKKLKIIEKNAFDTVRPAKGIATLTDDQFISRYSGYQSKEEIIKLFTDIKNHGGENHNEKGAKKVFDKVMDTIIEQQEKSIAKINEQALRGNEQPIATALKSKKILDELKTLKDSGIEGLSSVSKDCENILKLFFENPNNKLVTDAKGLNAILRSIGFAFEVLYLGFGLPALNQRRLEKRYLNKEDNFTPSITNLKSTSLNDNNIKPHEVQLYASFLRNPSK